jgi:hypothetical protein
MNPRNIALKSVKVMLWLTFFVVTITARITWNDYQKALKVPVSLGSIFIFTDLWDKGYFSGRGTWVVNGESQDNKLNMVEITCLQSQKTCAISVASVNDYGFGKPHLSNSLDIADIVRWDGQVIIYKDIKTCAETTFSIARETKSVTALRKYITNRAGCATDNPKEVTFNLQDGVNVYTEMTQVKDDVPLNIFLATIALLITIIGIYKVVKQPS